MITVFALHSSRQGVGLDVPEDLDQVVRPVDMAAFAVPARDAHEPHALIESGQRVDFRLRPIWFRHVNEIGTNASDRQHHQVTI